MRDPRPVWPADGAQDSRSPAPKPSIELDSQGLDTARAVSDALEAVQRREDRDRTTGRFLPGNTAAGTTLAHSEALWSELGEAKTDLSARVRSDLAAGSLTAETLHGLIDAYCEARLLRTGMFARMLEQGGPFTAKGKARAIFTTYTAALDREMKLAQLLGLERRSRPIDPLEAVRRAVEVANT